MGKILFWTVVIIGVLFITRLIAHYAAKRQTKIDKPKTGKPESLGKPEEMVRCANCGVYMPRSDAVKQNEQFWCSTEHAKAGVKEQR
ncbi:MAG: hypothetical protein LRY53_11850 [Burkholderiaceae bacterium]|nr:hypothetical protein [Burkholderiaceae bacterium]MCD8516802.1 hypothetical protein [Burkholderiaceae bacterium]MCD8538117.1 hypothetical protein [Burkholderiaceae bacterium]MCD8566279.1 hypothetical protein [Burkholderiaceae bacterium]